LTITLYKNSQIEADSPDLIYRDKWDVSPYESSSMFCAGETTEQRDFILPADITFNGGDVELKGFRYKNKAPCKLSTNDKGQPVLSVDSANYVPPIILMSQEEKKEQVKTEKKKIMSWVPGYDENGELEIY